MPKDPTKTAPLGNDLRERHPEIFEPSMRGIGAGRGKASPAGRRPLSRAQLADVETRIDRMGKRKDMRRLLSKRVPLRHRRVMPIPWYPR